LGIDIGALDAVIMLGFPMTISNFVSRKINFSVHSFVHSAQKQQAGRAGRRSRDSLAIMVADPFPIDQHFVQNPSELFENSLDDLILDVDNDLILEGCSLLLFRYAISHAHLLSTFTMCCIRDTLDIGRREMVRSNDNGNMQE
jgi:ATP-dependent helicase YprA (DUF1998 family)